MGQVASKDRNSVRNFLHGRPRWTALFSIVFTAILGAVAYSLYVGAPAVIYRGGLLYFSVRQDAPWLSRSVRLALSDPAPQTDMGQLTWQSLAPGLEIGELPVLVGPEEVDRLYLTRIDPALFKFQLRVDPKKNLDDWMRDLQPAALINGSYYDAGFGPATPVVIDGAQGGPTVYDGSHGAFVSSALSTKLVDLSVTDWRELGVGADTMLVSYPTLLDTTGANRALESRWLASRSFLAEDMEGKIILGSAPEGFFSLYRLGEFLKRTPLELRYVLNLDGGPVACHGVSAGGETRLVYGHVELQSDSSDGPLRVLPASRRIHAVMPIVLAVLPREQTSN